MKECPILFSGPMVRAILAGRKTQTRRVVKPQPIYADVAGTFSCWQFRHEEGGFWLWPNGKEEVLRMRPYGQPGDRLWVRETGWERPERTPKMMREGADTWARYYYDADGLTEQDAADFKAWGFKRRPSIFMPRWASRITLEITGARRVERLQEISSTDAEAEGVLCHQMSARGFVDYYRELWDSINAKRAPWASNPWVWVVEFKRA